MEPGAGEADEGLEGVCCFAVPCGEAAELLESIEAALDSVALFVEFPVVGSLDLAVAFGRDDGFCAHALDVGEDGVGIEGPVGEHGVGVAVAEQRDGLGAVVALAAGEDEVERQAVFFCQQVDLGRQSASGTPQSLVL